MRPTTTPHFTALGHRDRRADADFIGSFEALDDACASARDYARANPAGYALVYDQSTGTCEGEFLA